MTKLHRRFSYLNPIGLPLAHPRLRLPESGYFRGLHSIGFITYCQCDRSRRLFYVGTVGQTPPGETALHSTSWEDFVFNPLTLDLLHRTATFSPIRRIVLVTSQG